MYVEPALSRLFLLACDFSLSSFPFRCTIFLFASFLVLGFFLASTMEIGILDSYATVRSQTLMMLCCVCTDLNFLYFIFGSAFGSFVCRSSLFYYRAFVRVCVLVEWHILYNGQWESVCVTFTCQLPSPPTNGRLYAVLCMRLVYVPMFMLDAALLRFIFHCCCHCFHLFYYVRHGFGMASLTVYMRMHVYGWPVSVHTTAVRAQCVHIKFTERVGSQHTILRTVWFGNRHFFHSFFSSFRFGLFRFSFFHNNNNLYINSTTSRWSLRGDYVSVKARNALIVALMAWIHAPNLTDSYVHIYCVQCVRFVLWWTRHENLKETKYTKEMDHSVDAISRTNHLCPKFRSRLTNPEKVCVYNWHIFFVFFFVYALAEWLAIWKNTTRSIS